MARLSGRDEYQIADWVREVPALLDQFEANASRRQFLFLLVFVTLSFIALQVLNYHYALEP